MCFKRQLLFRVLAVVIGFSPLIGFEAICRLNGWGHPQDVTDPFVGFSRIHRLFETNSSSGRYEIPKSRQAFFRPESFAATKGVNEFRIFCLGGSTVQGRPYAIETSFTTWLELSLTAADPTRTWEVVNCGGVSYASYRLVPILKEILDYEPDLIIVCTGHNEFLEERTYGAIRQMARWQRYLLEQVTRLRTFGVVRNLLHASRSQTETSPDEEERKEGPIPVTLPAEVDALLDYKGGLESYHLDDEWQQGVIRHYESNLRRMIHMVERAGIPLVLVNPVSNLRDCPPFKCETQPTLSLAEQSRFLALWNAAKQASFDDVARKTQLVQDVLAIDNRYADAYFLLGRCYEYGGDLPRAKHAYLRAKDEDVCPLRMLESMHEILENVSSSSNTPLVDVRRLFESTARGGIIGNDELIDHIHPRIRGHQRIADALLERMMEMGIVSAVAVPDKRDALYRNHLDALPAGYFPMGMERLNGLRIWAEGRVERTRPASPKP